MPVPAAQIGETWKISYGTITPQKEAGAASWKGRAGRAEITAGTSLQPRTHIT
jgi:hypothetical protein